VARFPSLVSRLSLSLLVRFRRSLLLCVTLVLALSLSPYEVRLLTVIIERSQSTNKLQIQFECVLWRNGEARRENRSLVGVGGNRRALSSHGKSEKPRSVSVFGHLTFFSLIFFTIGMASLREGRSSCSEEQKASTIAVYLPTTRFLCPLPNNPNILLLFHLPPSLIGSKTQNYKKKFFDTIASRRKSDDIRKIEINQEKETLNMR